MRAAASVLTVVHGEGWKPLAKPVQKAGPVSAQVSQWVETDRRPVRQEVAFYRKYTEALLRRFMRMSLQTGCVPSVLGIDPMRGKVSSYRVVNFEDAVIFIVDVEKCLKKVSGKAQAVLVRVALQEYTVGEAAKMLGVAENTVVKQYRAGLDELTEILLEVGLMKPERLR
jgi:hypothetical protein